MVCFKSCFTASKSRKRKQYLVAGVSSPSKHPFVSLPNSPPFVHGGVLEQIPEEPAEHAAEQSKEKKVHDEEEKSSCNVGKKVAFDFKVKTQEEDTLPAESKLNPPPGCSNQELEGGGLATVVNPDTRDRAANAGSDEESEGSYGTVMEESSGSLFSISIGPRKQADMGEKEVTSPLPKCSPDENSKNALVVKQLEDVKEAAEERKQHGEDKENVNIDINVGSCPSPEFSFKSLMDGMEQRTSPEKHKEHDVAVDSSLSNWLVGAGGLQSQSENSVESVGYSKERWEDRPVLGTLTIGVLKQVPANRTSPSKSRRQRFSGPPATGTVGSYWRQTGGYSDKDSGFWLCILDD